MPVVARTCMRINCLAAWHASGWIFNYSRCRWPHMHCSCVTLLVKDCTRPSTTLRACVCVCVCVRACMFIMHVAQRIVFWRVCVFLLLWILHVSVPWLHAIEQYRVESCLVHVCVCLCVSVFVCACVCECVCECVSVWVCCVWVCEFVSLCVVCVFVCCVCLCESVCVWVGLCVCVFVFECVCVCVYLCVKDRESVWVCIIKIERGPILAARLCARCNETMIPGTHTYLHTKHILQRERERENNLYIHIV